MPFTLLGSPNSGSKTKRKSVQWSSPYRYVFLEKIVPWLSYLKVTNIKIILIKKKMKNGQNWTFLLVFYMYHCSQAALMYNPDVTEVHIYVTQSNSKSPVQGEVEKFVKEFAQGGCPTYTREILSPFRIMDPPHSTFTIVKITIPLEKKVELSQFIFSKKYFVGKNIEPSWKSSWYKDYYSV